jgi:TPP-dependent pyruvate/acetoin dehydrogenase alpha subunit
MVEALGCESTDFFNVRKKIGEAVNSVRENRKPAFIEIVTHRFSGHSKSDKREYMSEEREKYWKENDPLIKIANELPIDVEKAVKIAVDTRIEEAFLKCFYSD